MRIFFTLGLMIVLPIITFSQTITIKDKNTNEPLELVTLMAQEFNAMAVTNSAGQADISAFKDANAIKIRSLGYRTVSVDFMQLKKDGFNLFLEPSNLNLDEVVVSATKWRQSTVNVPSKVVSISAREVALQNPQTAADLLSVSGKVYIQKSQQGGGSPMIRGFATNRLVYTVDGVRMNTAIFRGGNIQNVISLDPFATESTEVLFGPGSVMYGSDAIGGVMSFQTLTPEFSIEGKPFISGEALTRFSSANNETTGHVDVNMGWEKWAVVSSFSYWDYDNLRQGSHGPDDYIKDYYVQRIDSIDKVVTQDDKLLQVPTAYSQMNLMQKVRFSPNKNWDLQYGFHYSETSPYGRYDRHNRMRDGTARYAEWNYGPQKWMMNNLNIQHTYESLLYDQANIRLAWQSFEESRIDRSLNKSDRTTNTENVEAYSGNIDFIKHTGARNTITYGVEFVADVVESEGEVKDILTNISSTGPSRYPDSEWLSMAAYVNNEFKMNDMLSFMGGLRYNHFILNADFTDNLAFYPFDFEEANINNGALTGSIGSIFRPTHDWVFKLNMGTAFRSPNVDDIGKIFDSEQGAVVVPNPDLEAEYAYNIDFGVAKVFDDFLKVDVTGFYTILENAIVRRDYQLNGQDSIMYDGMMSKVLALQNAAVATVYGVQTSVELKLPAGFTLSSDLNYQVGEEELGDGSTSPSRHAAPIFGTTRLAYQAKKLNLQVYTMYQGERSHKDMPESEKGKDEIYALDADGNTYAPAWYTLNVKAMYKLSDAFQLTAGVENITDQRYRPYSSGISGPGRNFIFSMKYIF